MISQKGGLPVNTKISYLYRDAENYKKVNECVIAGALTAEQICAIKDCCDMGEYFSPSQVGLPERRFDRYDPAVDHCWFELDEDSFSETIEPPTVTKKRQVCNPRTCLHLCGDRGQALCRTTIYR